MALYTTPQPFEFVSLPVSHVLRLVLRAYVHAASRCCNSASNRMVTIGPLIVLGLLGVTFYIGARLATPVKDNKLSTPQARSANQSDINVLPTLDPLTPTSVLQRESTSDISMNDNFQVVELPRFRSALQRDRTSGDSGDTIALSRNKTATTSADSYTGQPRPAGRELEPSTTTSLPTGLHDAAVDLQDRATGQTTRRVAGSPESAFHQETSLRNSQQLETDTGTEADLTQV